MKPLCVAGILLLLGVVIAKSDDDSVAKECPVDPRYRELRNLNDEQRMVLLGHLDWERYHAEEALLQELARPNAGEKRIPLVYLLGRYRMEGAVRKLAKLVDLEYSATKESTRPPLWGRYPVVEALINIGNPSIRAMIENIEQSDDEKVRELSARVIHRVEGSRVAKVVVEMAIEDQTNVEGKERLRAALKYFDEKAPSR